MKELVFATSIFLFASASPADPVTAPEHAERNYRAIGGGLYLTRDDDLTADENGNMRVTILSRARISAGGNYTLDITDTALSEIPTGAVQIDAGTLGNLRVQIVTIDCVNRTYEAFDTRKLLPQGIWRAASTLPVLAPVFAYVCKHSRSSSGM